MQIKITITPDDFSCLINIRKLMEVNGIEGSGIIEHLIESYIEIQDQSR